MRATLGAMLQMLDCHTSGEAASTPQPLDDAVVVPEQLVHLDAGLSKRLDQVAGGSSAVGGSSRQLVKRASQQYRLQALKVVSSLH